MIQFTLGCIIIALSLFFGGKEILSNKHILANKESSLRQQELKVTHFNKIKQKFEQKKSDSIIFSAKLRENILNQLNVDDRKFDFIFKEPEEKGKKVIKAYKYTLQGFQEYGNILTLVGDLENLQGVSIAQISLNCSIETKHRKRKDTEISFKIEGVAYVYNEV